MIHTLRTTLRIAAWVALAGASAPAVRAEVTAFRISDLDWRDPHVFATLPGLGCADITNFDAFGIKGVNPALQASIQTDTDFDGQLDLNHIIVFDPLNPAAAGGTLLFGTTVNCTAPLAGTSCAPLSVLPSFSYDNTPALCLGPIAGTTSPYSPAIVQPATPCFVASVGTLTLNALFPITLQDTYIAATYSGNPATGLVNGLIRGFISETTANQTIIPEGLTGIDTIDGEPLSQLLRGGAGSCSQQSPATGDKDVGPGGVTGWYVYFNFVASTVPLVSATAVQHHPISSLELDAPTPNPFNPSTTIRYTLARASSATLAVYDAAGRRIVELTNGRHNAGPHQKMWNGRDSRGLPVSSGVYFVRLQSGDEVRVRKVALLK